MDLLQALEQYDFSEKEAKVYLAIISMKSGTIAAIVRKCGEKRSTVYSIVKELQRKGYVSEIDKNKVLSYSALSPDNILKVLEDRSAQFKALLPLFSAYTEKEGVAPKVEFYEGNEGIKTMYDDVLGSEVPVLAFLGTLKFTPEIVHYIYKKYFPQKVKKNIFSCTIVADSKENRALIRKGKDAPYKRERRIVKGLSFVENIIINMYGPNKVMFVVFTEHQPFGLIIHSRYLYEALRNIFEFMWKLGR